MGDDEKDRSRDRNRRERPTRFSEGSRERDRSLDRGKDRAGMKSSQCRVYVSNIPYEYRWQDLKDLFRSHVGEVSFVELFVDENEKPRGCGIVEFSEPQSVKKCLEVMHRFELKGRKIVIKEDFGNSRDKYGNLIGGGGKRGRDRDEGRLRDDRRGYEQVSNRNIQDGLDAKWGNTYGLSVQFLESLGIAPPLCNRVFVANLDYHVDKKKLKEVFRLAGKVQRVDLSVDKDGRSRGFAVVEYDHPVESVQAISMFNNQQLFDRVMTVRMDRANETLKLPEGLKGVGMGLGVNGEPLRDVARNLPSNNNTTANATVSTAGAGILGAVPTPALQMGISNALTGLNSVVGSSALGNLGATSAVLQAANLAGMGGLQNNLLTGGITSSDLGVASGLLNNGLVQNQSLAAMAGSGGGAGLSAATNMQNSFTRNDSGSGFVGQSNAQNFGGGNRMFQSNMDNSKNSFSGYGPTSRSIGDGFSSLSSSAPMLRSGGGTPGGKGGSYSNKILINNLPPTASYKMLSEKCNEFGDVQRVEDKGNGSVLVVYTSEWEAENALKNLDRARIDGRTINVCFF